MFVQLTIEDILIENENSHTALSTRIIQITAVATKLLI